MHRHSNPLELNLPIFAFGTHHFHLYQWHLHFHVRFAFSFHTYVTRNFVGWILIKKASFVSISLGFSLMLPVFLI